MALVIQRYRWPDPVIGPYRLEIRLDVVDGRLVPVRCTIAGEPFDDPDGMPTVPTRTAAIRRVEWAAMADRLAAEMRERWAPIIAASTHATDIALALAQPGTQKGRHRLYDDQHWAEVADTYLTASEKPVMAVAARYVVSRSTAGHWVERCRAKGLL